MVIPQSISQTIKNFSVRSCLGCGDSYIWKKFHEIIYSDQGDGMLPYCEECHNQLSIERKKELISQLVDKWRSNGVDGLDYASIECQAHNAVIAESNLLTN